MAADELRGRRVCVTGGAGFIGSHLVDALVPENQVTVLDDLSNGRSDHLPDEVELVEGDVRDRRRVKEAVAEVDVVVHLAGLVGVEQSREDPVRSHAVNVSATVQLLEIARRADARVIVASSAAVYGDPAHVPVAEDDPKRPTSPYGVDKLAIDHYARVFADVYDLPVVVLRYFNVYGPGQRHSGYSAVVSTFLERARRGDALIVHGDGEQTRDFVHVEDVVRATLLAATTDETGIAINVGSGVAHSIRDLATIVCEVTGRDPPIRETAARTGDVRHSRADLQRARNALGYHPTLSLRDGLEALAATDSPPRSVSGD